MSINSDYQKLEPGNTVRLFEVDGTAFGVGDVLRFHSYNIPHTKAEIEATNPVSPIRLDDSTLDGRVTYTRAGAASYIGQDGKIYQASANQWPLEIFGRTEPEPASTNLLTYSNAWANAAWAKGQGSVIANSSTAPDGSTTAAKWVPNTTVASHPIYRSGYIPTANTTFTFTAFLKSAGYNYANVSIVQSAQLVKQVIVSVDLINGVIVNTNDAALCSVVKLGNGWVKVTVTSTTAATVTADIRPAVYPTVGPNTTTSFAGDGTSGIYVWGGQFEQRSSSTSLIPTAASTASRPAAAASVPANGASGVKITYSTGETASLSFGSASSVAIPPASKPWGTRYITKIEYIGGSPSYDESKLPAKSIWWQGIEYAAWPCQIEGIESSTTGSSAQPKLTVANLDGSITALCLAYDDMLQAKVSIHDTLAKYLDARNFPEGNTSADPTQEKLKVYYIDSKSVETKLQVEFTLSSPMDLQGLQIPTRQLHSLCTWCIRGKYRSGDGCDYAGTRYFDKFNKPVSDPSLDVCSGNLTGCKLRFGENNELSFGGFPGTSLLRT